MKAIEFIGRMLFAMCLMTFAVLYFAWLCLKTCLLCLWKHQDAGWSLVGIILSAIIFVAFYTANFVLIGNKVFWCSITALVCLCSIICFVLDVTND